jgi:CHASE3 domain sensor protein
MANDSSQGRGLSRLFNDRKIATKIAIGFTAVLTITVVISASAYFAFGKVGDGFHTFARQSNNGIRAAAVDQNFLYVRWSAREYGLAGDAAMLDQAKKGMATLVDSVQKAETVLTNPERKRKMGEIGKEVEAYRSEEHTSELQSPQS